MEKSNYKYTVVAAYGGGLSRERDRKLDKAAKRESGSSGFCFFDGDRDVAYYFVREDAAKKCMSRLKKFKWPKVRLYSNDDE